MTIVLLDNNLLNSPLFPMRSRLFLAASLLVFLLPSSALALEGIGPRVTVSGTVEGFLITPKQAFDQVGGEVVIKAVNGQLVTVIMDKDSIIISEGKLSRRKQMSPANITAGMDVRVRGWRIDSKSLTASLFVILNVQLNPALSANGILQSIENDKIKVLSQNGQVSEYFITNETEVTVNYILRSVDGMTFIGKQVLLTLNPRNNLQIRNLTITGKK